MTTVLTPRSRAKAKAISGAMTTRFHATMGKLTTSACALSSADHNSHTPCPAPPNSTQQAFIPRLSTVLADSRWNISTPHGCCDGDTRKHTAPGFVELPADVSREKAGSGAFITASRNTTITAEKCNIRPNSWQTSRIVMGSQVARRDR
jgi:hypothetical protein